MNEKHNTVGEFYFFFIYTKGLRFFRTTCSVVQDLDPHAFKHLSNLIMKILESAITKRHLKTLFHPTQGQQLVSNKWEKFGSTIFAKRTFVKANSIENKLNNIYKNDCWLR